MRLACALGLLLLSHFLIFIASPLTLIAGGACGLAALALAWQGSLFKRNPSP